MPNATPNPVSLTLPVIELGCALIAVALALCLPQIGSRLFASLEPLLTRLARKRGLSIFVAGASACLLRLLILPISPIPLPWIQDDFSFLLAADTFAHGRLTNPTPAMWTHFESFHITLKPTYMSMYFPAQGLFLAAGQVIAGHPWWGVWASCGLMCAAICWMLQGWLPPGWALLGAMLAVLRLATFSYWIDTYTGGAVAAIGGALVLGAVPRIRRNFRTRDFFWMGLGLAILANSRPYEGLLVSVPAVVYVGWLVFGGRRPEAWPTILWRMIPGFMVVAGAICFLGYYDYRAFGNPLTLPYIVNRAQYSSAPHFLFQSARPEPAYRHPAMRNFYTGWELKVFRDETGSVKGFLAEAEKKLLSAGSFYFDFMLIPPLFMLPWVLGDRGKRFWTLAAIILTLGLAVETFFIPHYLAPASALILALLVQCMRHLRAGGASGTMLVRWTVAGCVFLAVIRVFAQPLHVELAPEQYEAGTWAGGTVLQSLERAKVLAGLEHQPGGQLAIVRYPADHKFPEWVYNSSDIDKSKVIWAQEMDPESNRELLDYYKERSAWLVEPDSTPPRIIPYPRESAGSSPNILAAKARP